MSTNNATNNYSSVLGSASSSAVQVTISSAAPSTGQVLTATSSSAANWATPAAAAPPDAQFLVLANNATLTQERLFTPSTGLSASDGGANSTYTLSVDQTFSPTWTGTHSFQDTKFFVVDVTDATKKLAFDVAGTTGITGTFATAFTTAKVLTFPDATDTVVARATTDTLTNKTIDSATNTVKADKLTTTGASVVVSGAAAPTAGQVLTATSGTAANWQTPTTGAPVGAQYVVMALDGTLTSERVLTAGTGLSLADGGANGNATLSLDQASSPTWTGTHSFQDTKFFIVDVTDATKRLQHDVTGTTGITGIFQTTFTTAKTLTFPDATDTVVARATTDTLTNKSLSDSTTHIVDNSDNTKRLNIDVTGTTGITGVLQSTFTTAKTLILPDASDTLVARATTDTGANRLKNKDLENSTVNHVDATDTAKKIAFQSSGATTATTLTLASVAAASKTLTFTDNASALFIPTTNASMAVTNTPSTGQVLTATGTNTATWQATTGSSGGGWTWVNVTGATQTMAAGTSYIADGAAIQTFTLPTTAAIGDSYKVVGKSSNLFIIAQNAGQTVHYGNQDTTTGATGTITSTNRRDVIEIACTVANTEFTVQGSIGGQFNLA